MARERYGCLTPWQDDPATMAARRSAAGYGKCEEAVVAQCRELLDKQLDYAPTTATTSSTPRRTPGWSRRPSATTASCTTAARRAGTCATRTCSRRSSTCSMPRRAERQGGGLGAQHPHRRCARDRHGRGARRAEHRPALPRELRRRGGADRLRHPRRDGRGGDRLGRRHGGQARAPSRPDSYERLCHDAGIAALPARPTPGPTRRCARGLPSRGSSASSA